MVAMHRHSRTRRVIALVAAYAIALQAILASLALAGSLAPGHADSLCVSAAAAGGAGTDLDQLPGRTGPADHGGCAICPTLCAGTAVTPMAAMATAIFAIAADAFVDADDALAIIRPSARVGLARAPPVWA